ncbi:ABC transporter D family member 1-like isoform X2 [Prunus dulcis]|uniref:ABC transporter D family member 1-like isoform X2 n=1 Tax=Prunus dulcis TaxID=3755 RepID=UPI0014825C1D|nr:ABC transporter D family member 1-like isoform X2 [Prunus dulcis]
MPSLQLLQLTEHGRSFMASRRKTLLLATGIVVAGGTVAYVQSRLSHKKHDAIGHYNGLNDNEETTEKVVTNDHKLKKPPRKKGGLKSLQVLAAILLSEMGQMGVRDLLALVSIVATRKSSTSIQVTLDSVAVYLHTRGRSGDTGF